MEVSKFMKLIDLSVFYEDNPCAEKFPVKIERHSHADMAKKLSSVLGLDIADFPDGVLMTHEDVAGQLHVGTHVDAPFHFGPLCEGRPSRTIDQLPIEWFYHDGVRLDLRHVAPKTLITVDDLKGALDKIGYTLKPFDIVLIWTGFDKFIYDPKYLAEQPGMSREGTLWLLDQGIKVIGIDCWGFDLPFPVMVAEVKKGNKGALLAAHLVGREKEYCHIEKLGQLDEIPVPYGFKVAAFPQKVKGGTAGVARVVAIVD